MSNLRLEKCVQSDLALVNDAQAGNGEAFGELLARHYRNCVNIASLILRDRAEAQDEVQMACWKAFKHLDQYHGDAPFLTWLIRIVVNQCLMLVRVRKRTRFVYLDAGRVDGARPVQLPTLAADPEEDVMEKELRELLDREIRHLPPLLRTVLVLRDVDELPMRNVAKQLRITVGAAKSRLLRARVELKDRVIRRYGRNRHVQASQKWNQLGPASSLRLLRFA